MSDTTAPAYFTAISTPDAPQDATDVHYEYAGTLAAGIAATSQHPEITKALIWASVTDMADQGIDSENIIGTLATTLALYAIEIFNPAVDLLEELHPGFDYRAAVGRTFTTQTETKDQEPTK
jgi:hypothetical protein